MGPRSPMRADLRSRHKPQVRRPRTTLSLLQVDQGTRGPAVHRTPLPVRPTCDIALRGNSLPVPLYPPAGPYTVGQVAAQVAAATALVRMPAIDGGGLAVTSSWSTAGPGR